MQLNNIQLKKNSILHLQTYVVLRDDFVCFNKITGEVITLNQTGYLLLKLLTCHSPIEKIAACISKNFEICFDSALKDIIDFYIKMVKSDIIKIEKYE